MTSQPFQRIMSAKTRGNLLESLYHICSRPRVVVVLMTGYERYREHIELKRKREARQSPLR
ncbi:hypothetical protein ACNFIA_28990 [Pseudomonas sp. NY15437]|uniref:hypothetical protein n=1 Tax=Pseudomonas sp. NY15437 TaxID=3400360 RepID=UPI003A8BBD7F